MVLTPLEPDSLTASSLDRVDLNVGFARAVIEKRIDGAVWADRTSVPRALHAWHPYGMSLIWGDALDEAIDAVVNHLRQGRYRVKDEWLQIDPRWHALDWDSLLGVPVGDVPTGHCPERFSRVNFGFDPVRFLALCGSDAPPEGWSVRRATEADFDLQGSVVPRHFWRNARQFLAHGGGWCIERDGAVGAIAFTAFRSGDELELGIETLPESRRLGLALAIATIMIRHVIDEGLVPVWSCRRENTASHELALRLGFYVQKVIPYYRLPAAWRQE